MTQIRVEDVCGMMDRWASPEWAASWDRIGLHAGRPDQPVEGVGVCLTVTAEVFRIAKTRNINLLVAHHPLIWDPLRALRMDAPAERLAVQLAAGGVSVFAAHTNLDVAPDGVNAALASRLGLERTTPLFPCEQAKRVKLVTFVPESHLQQIREAVCGAGGGVIGDYTSCTFSGPGIGTFLPGEESVPYSGLAVRVNEEPERRFEVVVRKALLPGVLSALFAVHPYEEPAYDVYPLEGADPQIGLGTVGNLPDPEEAAAFFDRVKRVLDAPAARAVVPDAAGRVRRVAVLGGSGGGEVARIPADVDAYVTGDLGYHDAMAARDRNLLVVDAGHHATEVPVLQEIARRIGAAFPALPVTVLSGADPFTVSPVPDA